MNPDDYTKKRDWLRDTIDYFEKQKIDINDYINDDVGDKYMNKYKDLYEPAWMEKDMHKEYNPHVQTPIARFNAGDLLNAGGIVALVVAVADGFNGWRYSVMRDGQLLHVDEVALNEWQAI
jgi:hypothetical protein